MQREALNLKTATTSHNPQPQKPLNALRLNFELLTRTRKTLASPQPKPLPQMAGEDSGSNGASGRRLDGTKKLRSALLRLRVQGFVAVSLSVGILGSAVCQLSACGGQIRIPGS